MTPSSLLSALQLRNRFTLESVADLPLFREAGLVRYYGPIWVVGPKTYNWICRQRGWAQWRVANALG